MLLISLQNTPYQPHAHKWVNFSPTLCTGNDIIHYHTHSTGNGIVQVTFKGRRQVCSMASYDVQPAEFGFYRNTENSIHPTNFKLGLDVNFQDPRESIQV